MNDDPVLARRARLGALARTGRRVGALLVAAAVAAFVVGAVQGFRLWGTVVVVALALSTVTLAPSIVLAAAVRAAERDDAERRSGG